MKRVILDCDGVMVNFCQPYLDLLNKYGGTNYTVDDVPEWDIVGSMSIPAEVAEKADADVDWRFCTGLPPLPGAIPGVRAILENADVLFVTSPWDTLGWTNARERWLCSFFGKVKVMHGSAKDWVDADVFVDDKASTVLAWAKAHPGKTAVLWDQPWNRSTPDGDFIRTNSWDFLLELVKM